VECSGCLKQQRSTHPLFETFVTENGCGWSEREFRSHRRGGRAEAYEGAIREHYTAGLFCFKQSGGVPVRTVTPKYSSSGNRG
jgi:hypothetical protein